MVDFSELRVISTVSMVETVVEGVVVVVVVVVVGVEVDVVVVIF